MPRSKRFIFIYVLAGLSMLMACTADESISDRSDLIISTFQIGGEDTVLKKQEIFDTAGQLLAVYTFGSRKNDTVQRILYHYNAEGLYATRTYVGDKLVREALQTTIGGRPIRVVTKNAIDTISITDFTYYTTGEIKRNVVQYGYDGTDPITIVTHYNKEGEIETIYKQIYEDSTRVVISRLEMDKFVHSYDESGKLIRSRGTFTFGYHELPDSTLDVRYTYDASGRLIKAHHRIKGVVSTLDSIRYVYNDAGSEAYRIEYHTTAQRNAPGTLADTIFTGYDSAQRRILERSTLSGRTFMYTYTE